MPSSTKTKQCPCGAKSGRDENGKSIHPLSVDDVWFDELELGSEFKLVALTYRHFTNTRGFMGKPLHVPTGTVFYVTSATAMDFAVHHAGEKLYPNAKN